ncbi:MAG TPA: anti-sigma factor [Sphingomicrobium sp.]|nr:anti-sigma factor [Sphingomicrobium sp.]
MSADEKFFAWLDGELAGAEAAEVEARVAADPELAALAEQHRALQARLAGAFDAVAAAPVPERLRAAALPSKSNLVDLAERRSRRFPALPQWAAIAATLVLGIFVGTLMSGDSNAPVEVRKGTIYAGRNLDRALNTELASAPSDGPVRIGLTFRDQAGDICRSFTASAATGLACRHDGRWQVRGLFPVGEGQSGDYRMAAGMNPGLAALLDATMAGEPMDGAQEAEARKSGWR